MDGKIQIMTKIKKLLWVVIALTIIEIVSNILNK